MDTIYQLQGVAFEWNADKAQSNIEKHGVTFEEAAEVFFDPFYQSGDATEEGEPREFISGLFTCATAPPRRLPRTGERTRIISARPCNPPGEEVV